MPKYIDHHRAPEGVTPEALQQMGADVRAGKTTPSGVKGLNGFIGTNEMWCFVEAPNAQAVHDLHKEAYGIELGSGDVVEVQSIV